ncbi:hypothetical protein [Asticcacaulis sp. AC402]|uniref:hypothetical protein n=1 Tax=Asticcacaulis sp. AC402 TaxID=1282361 RepID=UPI0012DC7732|nr:hypothetical protein [Asticcacaulis sp. AC402]
MNTRLPKGATQGKNHCKGKQKILDGGVFTVADCRLAKPPDRSSVKHGDFIGGFHAS